MKKPDTKHKNAIVFAAFGTTKPDALQDILSIRDKIQSMFPETVVEMAFTSNIIRKIWHKRKNDAAFQKQNPKVPDWLYQVKGPLYAVASLQDAGFDNIIVQPAHLSCGEEFLDLSSYIDGLNSIKTIKKKYMPFNKLVLGRPAMGTFGTDHPYAEDIKRMAAAMEDDIRLAEREDADALVYMGHGNEYFPSGGAYLEFENEMRNKWHAIPTYVGTVEGFPGIDNLVERLKRDGIKKIILKPLMIVAGDHARNDMAGDEPGSWKNILKKNGVTVIPEIKGLGTNSQVAQIFADHARDAANEAGIHLD